MNQVNSMGSFHILNYIILQYVCNIFYLLYFFLINKVKLLQKLRQSAFGIINYCIGMFARFRIV